MPIISLIQLKQYIISGLQKYSIDELYNNKHTMFEYKNSEIRLNQNTILTDIKNNFDSENILPNEFTTNNFIDWIERNSNRINNFEPLIQEEIELYSKNIIEYDNKISQINDQILQNKQVENDFEQILSKIISNISENRFEEKEFAVKINENKLEIEKIKNLEENEKNKSKINELLEINNNLTVKSREKFDSLYIEFGKVHAERNKILRENKKLRAEIKDLKIRKANKEKEKVLFIKKDIKFDKEKEAIAKNTILEFLFGKHQEGYIFDPIDFNKTEIFKTVFNNKFEIVDVKTIRQSLLTVFSEKIPDPNILLIYSGENYNSKKAIVLKVTSTSNSNSDNLAAIFFSMKNALTKYEIIQVENGISYLNVNNGIFVKILTRKNSRNIKNPAISLIARKTDNSSTSYSLTYNKNIFGGNSESGFILNNGLYITLKDYIFELYFDANSMLLNNNQIKIV
jgi:hypothetical protein